jgi:pyrroloquinoline quinone (PQQ) biosynthesis protein C
MIATISNIDTNIAFAELDQRISKIWEEILDSSELIQTIINGKFNKYLYAIYMLETYHYTSHNAANQALVGIKNYQNSIYTKFCFRHAYDETGHEKMALHDLLSIGLDESKFLIPEPLPETETLIAYLYWISFNGNPLRRLGYSYWAESSYEYINPLVDKIKNTLNLNANQMTFFIAHSDIDENHAEEVKSIILRTCINPDDWKNMATTAETSLRLTGCLLDGVYREYQLFIKGESERYGFLNESFCVS